MPTPLIAIIDDDHDVRLALVHLVRSMGLRANGHISAEAFLASGDPDAAHCIVTDVSIPGMNGIELKTLLDARGSLVPVIMITAHFELAILAQARACNPFRMLTKPFDTAVLAAAIDQALASGGRSEP